MSILSKIVGKSREGEVHEAFMWPFSSKEAALIVASLDDTRSFLGRSAQVLNDTYGDSMVVNASIGGTPDGVHNGTDTVLWTGSGTAIFDSTDVAQAGTKSVLIDTPALNSIVQFTRASPIGLSAYTAITVYVYVSSNWSAGDTFELYGFDTSSGLEVGNRVSLGSYINISSVGTWQKATINLDDMNLSTSTIDALRIQYTTKSGKAPTIYLDTFGIEETGGAIRYTTKPTLGHLFVVSKVRIVVAASITTSGVLWSDFFGLGALDAGVIYTEVSGGRVVFSSVIRSISDLLVIGFVKTNVETNGAASVFTFERELPIPLTLDSREKDSVGITINDNLSTLLLFKSRVIGKEVEID